MENMLFPTENMPQQIDQTDPFSKFDDLGWSRGGGAGASAAYAGGNIRRRAEPAQGWRGRAGPGKSIMKSRRQISRQSLFLQLSLGREIEFDGRDLAAVKDPKDSKR
jgi:hypothetical protein